MATIYFVILWSFDQTNATQIIFKHGEPERATYFILFQRKDLLTSYTYSKRQMLEALSKGCSDLKVHSVLLSEPGIPCLVTAEEFKTQPLVYAGGGSMSGPGSEQ